MYLDLPGAPIDLLKLALTPFTILPDKSGILARASPFIPEITVSSLTPLKDLIKKLLRLVLLEKFYHTTL